MSSTFYFQTHFIFSQTQGQLEKPQRPRGLKIMDSYIQNH